MASTTQTMKLSQWHTTTPSSQCFVPDCDNIFNKDLVPLSDQLRQLILQHQDIYIMNSARMCRGHDKQYNWWNLSDFKRSSYLSNMFTGSEVGEMLTFLREQYIKRDNEQSKKRDGEQSKKRDGEQSKKRDGEQSKKRDGEQTIKRDGEQSKKRDGEQSKKRDGEPSNKRDGEQSKKRDGEQSKKRDGEQ